MSIRFFVENAIANYNSQTKNSTDVATRRPCVAVSVKGQQHSFARLELGYPNLSVNDSADINGKKFTSLFAPSADFESVAGTGIRRLTGTAGVFNPLQPNRTQPPPQEFTDNLVFKYTVNTANWANKIPAGATEAIRIGLEKAIWIIGSPAAANQYVARVLDGISGFGFAVSIQTGDVLEIRQTPTTYDYVVNGVVVESRQRLVFFAAPANLGALSNGGWIPANQTVQFTPKASTAGLNGNITATFNDYQVSNLAMSIAAFEIVGACPSHLKTGQVRTFTASDPAVWSDGGAGGQFSQANGTQTNYTAPGIPGNVTVRATSQCDNAVFDVCAFPVQLPVSASVGGVPVPSAPNALKVQRNSLTAFAGNGGSGNYRWQTSAGVIGATTGIFLAPISAIDVTIAVIDAVTGEQFQFLVSVEATMDIQIREVPESPLAAQDDFTESTLECGECTQFEVPAAVFTAPEFGAANRTPDWARHVLMDAFGSYNQLTSRAAGAGAFAQCIPNGASGRYTQTIHQSMISAAADSIVAGLSDGFAGGVLNDVQFGIGINADGDLEIWESGVSKGTFGDAVAGHTVSVSREVLKEGQFVRYYHDDELIYTSAAQVCGDLCVNITAGAPNIVFAGAAQAMWAINTAGTALEVGSINVNGRYCAPADTNIGEVEIIATVGAMKHYRRVYLVSGISLYQDPTEFVTGDDVECYLLCSFVPVGEKPRVTRDGKLDRLTHPHALPVGEVEDGYNFKDDNNFKEIGSDRGTIRITRTKPTAMLDFTMLGHRNVRKLLAVFSQLTAKRIPGAVQVSAGRGFYECWATTVFIRPSTVNAGKYDALVLHRSLSMSNIDINYKTDEFVKHKISIKASLDTRRPKDEQLYSFYFNLEPDESGSPCEV